MVAEALSGVVSQGPGRTCWGAGAVRGRGGKGRGRDRNPRSSEHFQLNLRRFLNASFTREESCYFFSVILILLDGEKRMV